MSKGINKNTHKLSGVYEIRNTLNNKRYIGSSINIYRRWRDHKRKNNKKAVYQIDPATEEIIAEYSSTKEAAMQFSKSTYSSISLCCNGKYKTAFGFKWKYKNYDNKIDINQNSDS